MALQMKYQEFLSRPTTDALAPGASLHYIPTAVTITEPAAILKHFATQNQQLKKKENFLNVTEGPNGICAETETTIQFEGGGGTFLPGLDDNFLADRTVSLPVIHTVGFNKTQKIQQIRLMWDQGSMLKSVEVVGSRGKNWPLVDGKDQIRTLTASVDASLSGVLSGVSLYDNDHSRHSSRAGADSQIGFQPVPPRNPNREESPAKSVASRASARPPARDLAEIFYDNIESTPERSLSPTKRNPLKGGAGKNYQENRLFGETPLDSTNPLSPERINKKAHAKKYSHFEFGEEPLNVKATDRKSKHASQWDFDDFVTPEKPRTRRHYPGQQRQYDWSEFEGEAQQPQVHREHKPQPRKDAETHFEFNDEATPRAGQNEHVRPKEDRMGLYEDHINLGDPNENDRAGTAGSTAVKVPLGNLTNVNAQGHKKNFSSQWEMTDNSTDPPKDENTGRGVPEPRKKVAKTMEANWSMFDDSPPVEKHQGIAISGDSMGGRKNTGEKSWWEYE